MQDQQWASVFVEDAGPGIDASERERLFDPFFRGTEARANNSGFGLGLPILRRVARVHGGDVAVERSSLGGARFELQLPRWRPESQSAQTG
jgi:two-component system OmpR family sensor kinase